MGYSDGLMVLGSDIAAVAQNAVTGVVKTYRQGYPMQIEGFGVVITTTFGVSATDPVIKLQKIGTDGSTITDLVVLTLGNSNTNLKKGDGTKALVTAIVADTDLVAGALVMGKRSAFPIAIVAGEQIQFNVTVQGSSAVGAYVPVVLLRAAGEQVNATNTWIEDA